MAGSLVSPPSRAPTASRRNPFLTGTGVPTHQPITPYKHSSSPSLSPSSLSSSPVSSSPSNSTLSSSYGTAYNTHRHQQHASSSSSSSSTSIYTYTPTNNNSTTSSKPHSSLPTPPTSSSVSSSSSISKPYVSHSIKPTTMLDSVVGMKQYHRHVSKPMSNQEMNTTHHASSSISTSSSSSPVVEIRSGSKQKVLSPLILLCLLGLWYISCSFGAITNKSLMKEFHFPATLTYIHLITGSLFDLASIRSNGIPLDLVRDIPIIIRSVPIALALSFGKSLTYLSYTNVPASLTATIKSLAPVFSVLLTFFLTKTTPRLPSLLSLIPICLGVTLAAVTDIDFHLLGFFAALFSTVLGVVQSTYTKSTLSAYSIQPVVFHLYTCTNAAILSLPYLLYSEGSLLWKTFVSNSDTIAIEGGEEGEEQEVEVILSLVPWVPLFLSLLFHYSQNMCSIYILSSVNVLTHQVANTLKRLVIIVASIFYFGNEVSFSNGFGMGLSLVGFLLYSLSRTSSKQSPSSSSSSSSSSASSSSSSFSHKDKMKAARKSVLDIELGILSGGADKNHSQ